MPGKMCLVADQRGSSLSLSGKVIVLETATGERHRIGIGALKEIVVTGDIMLSSALMRICSSNDINIICLSNRGQPKTLSLLPQDQHRIDLRLAQFRAFEHAETRMTISREVITEKLVRQQHWLQEKIPDFSVQSLIDQIQHAANTATLMGIEGAAANSWIFTPAPIWPTLFSLGRAGTRSSNS